MKLNRFFKIIFLSEFIKGIFIAIKEIFSKKKTINYPFEKGKISPRSVSYTHLTLPTSDLV